MPICQTYRRARLESIGRHTVNPIVSTTKQKRAGLLLVAIGIAVPLLLLLITTGYNPDVNFFVNIFNLRITVYDPFVVPYRFPLAFCIFLIFLGVRKLECPQRNAVKGDDTPVS